VLLRQLHRRGTLAVPRVEPADPDEAAWVVDVELEEQGEPVVVAVVEQTVLKVLPGEGDLGDVDDGRGQLVRGEAADQDELDAGDGIRGHPLLEGADPTVREQPHGQQADGQRPLGLEVLGHRVETCGLVIRERDRLVELRQPQIPLPEQAVERLALLCREVPDAGHAHWALLPPEVAVTGVLTPCRSGVNAVRR
jgi:hypothetical protein